MNLPVAHGAGLIFGRLVVHRAAWVDARIGVALQAEHVYQADFEQARVGGTVGRVATAAAIGFYRNMLVDIRALLFGVALEANGVAAGEGLQLAHGSGAVRVMAITALDETLLDAVVIRLGKIRLLRRMAAVTEVRLALHEKVLFLGRVMGGVAIKAANFAAGVSRFRKMGLLVAVAMAA